MSMILTRPIIFIGVRFADQENGNKIVAGKPLAVWNTPPSFVFNVVNRRKGYLRVSEDDERYFVFENGDFFPNLGYNLTFNQVDWINPRSNAQQNKFSAMADNGIQYARIWLTQWSIFGSSWNPWKHHNDAAATGLSAFPGDVYSPESELSLISVTAGIIALWDGIHIKCLLNWIQNIG